MSTPGGIMSDVVTANVRCAGRDQTQPSHSLYAWESCGWEGPADDARTDNTHTVGRTVVREYRCPKCGGRVHMGGPPP